MDEIQKTEMRNYAMAAGFFLIAAQSLIRILGSFFNLDYNNIICPLMIGILPAIIFGLISVSVILIILKKRDLVVSVFIMFLLYFGFIYIVEGSRTAGSIIIGMFALVFSIVILTSKHKAKYPMFIIPALLGISMFFAPIIGTDSLLIVVIRLLITILCIYYTFACISERFNLPFSEIIKADSDTDFKVNGSATGYLLLGAAGAALAVFEISGGTLIQEATCNAICLCCGVIIIVTGVMLFIIGKMQFTPVLFLLSGILIYISIFTSGILLTALGALFIFVGLFAVLRNDARILPAFIMIIFGLAFYASILLGFGILSGCLFLLSALISIYLCFGLISGYKLPLV